MKTITLPLKEYSDILDQINTLTDAMNNNKFVDWEYTTYEDDYNTESSFRRNHFIYIHKQRGTVYKGYSKEDIDNKIMEGNSSLINTIKMLEKNFEKKEELLDKTKDEYLSRKKELLNMSVKDFRRFKANNL